MRHFAEHGYQGARVEDLAREVGIAKGSIFQHFGSKAGLFLATYKRAVSSLPAWLDAPSEVVETGFWPVLEYWLERTEHLIHDDWVPYRVSLIGNYGTDLTLKRDINRFLLSEDPYGTLDFVEFGIRRNEVRDEGHSHAVCAQHMELLRHLGKMPMTRDRISPDRLVDLAEMGADARRAAGATHS